MVCQSPKSKDRFLERPSMLNSATTSQVWARRGLVRGGDQSSTRQWRGDYGRLKTGSPRGMCGEETRSQTIWHKRGKPPGEGHALPAGGTLSGGVQHWRKL